MKYLLLLALFTGVAIAKEPTACKQVKIAVIDTGFGYQDKGHDAKLCDAGHVDFTKQQKFVYYGINNMVPEDVNGHGTNIVGIIDSYAKKSGINYCIMILKYYSDSQTGKQNLAAGTAAMKMAEELGADFINYSGGGPEFDEQEYLVVKKFLDRGGRFVAAAGNEHQNIDVPGNEYYPAKYDKREIVVGNYVQFGVRSSTSNFGHSVNRWEIGTDVEAYGLKYSGTSQATAVATGKIVSELPKRCDIGRYPDAQL